MTSSRSAETILHCGTSDQSRGPSAQDILTMVKQVQQDLPACRHPDSSRAYLISGHVGMNTTYGNQIPRVKGAAPQVALFGTNTISTAPCLCRKNPRVHDALCQLIIYFNIIMANVKTNVGPFWKSFIQSELSSGAHKPSSC